MPFFLHDHRRFHYLDQGAGTPFFWQHGLGGDAHLACALIKPPRGFRLVSLDARGHGRTAPLGEPAGYSFELFGDDLLALMDHLGLARAILGGVSMGAGLALNVALRHPERVLGLVLCRPAWLDRPHPWNTRLFSLVARLLREHGARRGRELFEQTEEYRELVRQGPDAARSAALQFTAPHAVERAALFEAFAHEAPCRDRRLWAGLRVPTLVLATRHDPVHPFALAEELARGIPGAALREITAKSVSLARHGRDLQREIATFLGRHFGGRVPGHGFFTGAGE